jgi:hypothetical protein
LNIINHKGNEIIIATHATSDEIRLGFKTNISSHSSLITSCPLITHAGMTGITKNAYIIYLAPLLVCMSYRNMIEKKLSATYATAIPSLYSLNKLDIVMLNGI